jgi:iron complex transport system substrate-binding protein
MRVSLTKALFFTLGLVASCNNSSSSTSTSTSTTTSTSTSTPTAHRVVSLSPSTTETVFAIGAGSSLVGRSRYCDYPEQVKALPQVGGYVDPNLEAILALKPDLVTGARGPQGRALVDTLEARGIATYFPPTERFDEIDAMVKGLGERTGQAANARTLVDTMHAKVADVERTARAKPRVRVLLLFGIAPVVAAGPDGFPNEMITRANGENVVKKGGGYPTLSIETVIALDPDVIVNAAIAESHGGQPITKDTPGWASVRAVKEGHVASIDDESVLRPGPRIGDGLAILSRTIHGAP